MAELAEMAEQDQRRRSELGLDEDEEAWVAGFLAGWGSTGFLVGVNRVPPRLKSNQLDFASNSSIFTVLGTG